MVKHKVAFTLVELLVVMTIINLLSSVVLVSANSARFKARMVQRVTNLREIQKALELYNLKNDSYPTTGGAWYSEFTGGGFTAQPKNQWVPQIVPQYLRGLPTDPFMDPVAAKSCYAYRSDSSGKDYKLMLYLILDNGGALDQNEYLNYPQLLDPRRDKDQSSTHQCTVETSGTSDVLAWAIYTQGACAW